MSRLTDIWNKVKSIYAWVKNILSNTEDLITDVAGVASDASDALSELTDPTTGLSNIKGLIDTVTTKVDDVIVDTTALYDLLITLNDVKMQAFLDKVVALIGIAVENSLTTTIIEKIQDKAINLAVTKLVAEFGKT